MEEGKGEDICSNCGELFRCDLSAGSETCWCQDMPFKLPVSTDHARCYCPKCLKEVWTRSHLS